MALSNAALPRSALRESPTGGPPRRRFAAFLCAGSAIGFGPHADAPPTGGLRSFMERAFEMKRRALAAGDQPYGAVVVKDGRIIAESPSRVVTANNINAHAEREALRLARATLGGKELAGCLLVSSSRPCSLCERAAFEARIARMIHGENLTDAGAPRG